MSRQVWPKTSAFQKITTFLLRHGNSRVLCVFIIVLGAHLAVHRVYSCLCAHVNGLLGVRGNRTWVGPWHGCDFM